jgi:hypothetical protein
MMLVLFVFYAAGFLMFFDLLLNEYHKRFGQIYGQDALTSFAIAIFWPIVLTVYILWKVTKAIERYLEI